MTNQFNSFPLNTGDGDFAYRSSDFFDSKPDMKFVDHIMCVNERIVGVISIICNTCVIIVFFRVLGLNRLISSLFVSVAASNIVRGFAIILHSVAVTEERLSNTKNKCRFLYVIESTTSELLWSCYAAAIVERIITTNMSSHYLTSMTVMSPTLIYSPWIYWIYRLFICFILRFHYFPYDLGYSCKHHLMNTVADDPIQLMPSFSELATYLLTFVLIMSSTLHPPHYDDMWEANRLRLEFKTTTIWLQMLIPTFIMMMPSTIVSIVMGYWDHIYVSLHIKHICFQINIYRIFLLFVVLMTRREFRRAFRYLFAKKESISHSVHTNFLVAAAEISRKHMSIALSQTVSKEKFQVPLRVMARDDYKSLLAEPAQVQIKTQHNIHISKTWFSHPVPPERSLQEEDETHHSDSV